MKEKIISEFDKLEDIESFKEPIANKNTTMLSLIYQPWYTKALAVIKQVAPERYDEFKEQYISYSSRKKIDISNYTISDYLNGVTVHFSDNRPVFDSESVFSVRFVRQLSILKATREKLDSALMNIENLVAANLFDNELDVAKELCSKGFLRAAGVLGGVTLERHLALLCKNHTLVLAKPNSTIADYNEILKANNIYDVPKWRFIQHLADLRNLCGHNKGREPTKEEVNELLEGVKKVIKTYY